MRTRSVLCLMLALPALVVAGCGDDDGGDSAATMPTTPAATTPAEKTTPTATTPSAGRSAIAISGTEFKFTPSDVDVRAGSTTFRLRNDGGAPHALEIEGQGIEEKTEVVQGGQTADVTVNLRPGRYEMYCPVGNHRDMGMAGTVTVS